MASNEELSRFIQSSFRSVWSLELLLLLKREQRPWSREEIVTSLRGSDLIVSQGFDTLSAGGLILVDENGKATYGPASASLAKLVEEAEAYYARSPDAVRRLIIGASPSGLAAFADAFRLRKD